MASSSSPYTYEHYRPRMLKDFLRDDASKLLRSKSKPASTAISAIQRASKIIIKFLPFTSIKSSLILPRSITRKLSKHKFREDDIENNPVKVTVKVKDILRWRSFRDTVDDKPPPLDSLSSPNHCTTTTTITRSTTNSTATSSKSCSWCESDFTAEDSPSWCGDLEVEMGKKCLPEKGVGGDCIDTTRSTTMDPKGEFLFDEKDQHSPGSPFQENEELFSSFHESITNMERRRRMLMQKIPEFKSLAELEQINFEEEKNEIEVKAKHLLNHVETATSAEIFEADLKHLLFDFFMNELLKDREEKGDKFDYEMLRVAAAWVSSEYEGSFEREIEGKREEYIRDMERGGRWRNFVEEREEVAMEVEIEVLSGLVDEVLVDLLCH